jgi:glycosyltransferase involved in cell wall biosynthesis
MLEKLAEQTYPLDKFEVVVVVDGGTDGTPQMLESLSLPFTLRVIRQEQSGPSVARNRGAQEAAGDLVIFLDDDLLPVPGLVREHVKVHEQDAQAVVLGRFLGAKGEKKGGWNVWEEQILDKHYRRLQTGKRAPAGRRLYSGNFSVPRGLFLAAGGFDVTLKRGEDVELGLRLERHGLRFHFNPDAAAVHRGFRSFTSWCNSAYMYGRCDVELTQVRGHSDVLPQALSWFYKLPAATQWVVRLSVGRPALRAAMIWMLKTVSGGLNALGMHRLSHYGYGGIYKLQYWEGITDALGGRAAFEEQTRRAAREDVAVGAAK